MKPHVTAVLATVVALFLVTTFIGCDSTSVYPEESLQIKKDEPSAQPLEYNTLGQPQEHDLRTLDQQFVDLVEKIPGFGGFYQVENGMYILRIKRDAVKDIEVPAEGIEQGILLSQAPTAISSSIISATPRTPTSALSSLKRAAEKDSVLVLPAEYDFAELQRHRDQLIRANILPINVSFVDTDEVENRVVVGIHDGRSRFSDLYLEARSAGLSTEAIVFVPASKIVASDDLWDKRRPTQGGLKITRGPNICTMGFNLKLTSTTYAFLTAEHCTAGTFGSVLGTVFYQPSVDRVGIETHSSHSYTSGCPYTKCFRSDVAVIQYDSGVTSQGYVAYTQPFGNQLAPITSAFPMDKFDTSAFTAGITLYKPGAGTGTTKGHVDRTCADISTGGGSYLVCQYSVERVGGGGDPIAAPGDSSAPVWRVVGLFYLSYEAAGTSYRTPG